MIASLTTTLRFSMPLLLCGIVACSTAEERADVPIAGGAADTLILPEERPFFSNIRQLTFGGENAEGYFSFDEESFVFQRTFPERGDSCDQIYTYRLSDGMTRRVSDGTGRTTCAYYLPGDTLVLYATTHLADPVCPPPPDYSQGYVWPIYPTYDIVIADTAGNLVRRLTDQEGYDAEATVSPTGERIVFTSMRDGDLDLYSMNLDGSDVQRLTELPGYDGGAFYSWDGEKIVFRASRPAGEELAEYRRLLTEGLIRPGRLEIFVMDADGGNVQQVTDNGAANFGPFWHPDGEHIIFSSNMDDPSGREFDLYLIRSDGTGLQRLTYTPEFDGFPMFNRDGDRLIFASNRGGSVEGETNLFLVDFAIPGSEATETVTKK